MNKDKKETKKVEPTIEQQINEIEQQKSNALATYHQCEGALAILRQQNNDNSKQQPASK